MSCHIITKTLARLIGKRKSLPETHQSGETTMALFEQTNNNARAQVPAQQREKTKLWLNIGYERNGRFVNLPVGIPLDTTAPAPIRGTNAEWNAFQSARNELLKFLTDVAAKLEAGGEEQIDGLTIRVKKIADEPVVEEDNAFAADLSSMLSRKKVEAPVQE